MVDLVFFSSPIGLGHATRDIAISHNLENISKRFVSGGAAASIISQNGFDVDDLYSPPTFQVENGKLQTSTQDGSSSTILTTKNVKQFHLKYLKHIIQDLL